MKKTYQDWKLSQIDNAYAKLEHYWKVIQNLEADGADPADPIFNYLADRSWLEYYRIEVMSYQDHRFYFSSDNDLEKN